MERTRSKAKVEKAVENWKRLQEERQKEANNIVTVKLEKILTKRDSQVPPLKEIA